MSRDFYSIKDEIRIIGFDDGPFSRGDESVLVVGCVFRGGRQLDGVVSARVMVDGLDSTDVLAGLLKDLRFKDVRVVMIDGIAFGGFNVVDIRRLSEETGYPVICVTRDRPDFDAIKAALEHTDDPGARFKMMACAGEPVECSSNKEGSVYIQFHGIGEEDAKRIVAVSSTHSFLPEPLRCAHIIASGVVSGQSRGKA